LGIETANDEKAVDFEFFTKELEFTEAELEVLDRVSSRLVGRLRVKESGHVENLNFVLIEIIKLEAKTGNYI